MRSVCYIAPDVPIPYPTGASVHVSELASNLSRLGHDVHVIARRVRSDEKSTEVTDGYTVHRVYRWVLSPSPAPSGGTAGGPMGSSFGTLYYLYLRTLFAFYVSTVASGVIRKNRLEVIIERETAFGAGGISAALSQRPMVLEIIGPRYSRLSARRSSEILYYTESMLREWVDRGKCHPIEAGVNTELFHRDPEAGARVRGSLGIDASAAVVGYVGSFQPWHGVDTLMKSVRAARERGAKLTLLLVGPAFEPYRPLSESLGLSDACRFVGSVRYEEVPGYINACDIMAAPYEPAKDPLRKKYGIGWPIKVLEYMACGKPVVTTRIRPLDRFVEDGKTGLMVKPGDAGALADAILRLAGDKELARRISTEGMSMAASRYSWAAVASKLSDFVQEA
jgi:glycosyltransferase involved in cell wall biosynthesis